MDLQITLFIWKKNCVAKFPMCLFVSVKIPRKNKLFLKMACHFYFQSSKPLLMAVRGVVFDVSEGKGKTKMSSTCNNCTYKLIIRTLRFSVRFTFKIENL